MQIQNTNVHTPRPMRGAIPRAQNLRFATVSRDRPTESYERVHPAKSKCAFRYSGVPSKMSKCTCHPKCQNARFATAACTKMYEMSAWRRQSPAAYKNHRFTTVSNDRPERSDERVPRPAQKFAFHHSFGRPTSTK